MNIKPCYNPNVHNKEDWETSVEDDSLLYLAVHLCIENNSMLVQKTLISLYRPEQVCIYCFGKYFIIFRSVGTAR